MSYLIHIARFPVSDSNEQAWKQLQECLSAPDRMSPQAPLLLQFIDQITKAYPSICDLNEESEDEAVWSDGPIRNNVGSREVTLGIVGDTEEVMSVILQAATDLSLTVFDPQTGEVLRPQPGKTFLSETSHSKLTMKEINQVAKDWILRELKPHGFRSRGKEVYRKIPGGWQGFFHGVVDRLPIYAQILFGISIRIDEVQKLAAELNEFPLRDMSPTIYRLLPELEPSLDSYQTHHQGPEFKSMSQFEEYLQVLTPVVRNKVVPMFDRVRNVYDLAKEFPITLKNLTTIRSLNHFGDLFAFVYLSGGDWESLAKQALPKLETLSNWGGHDDRNKSMWDRVLCNLRKLPPLHNGS